jgi:membrane fusion protein (multidrug efflux system)
MKISATVTAVYSAAFLLLSACGNNKQQGGAPAAGGPPPVQSYPAFKADIRTATLNSDYPATIQGQQCYFI